MFTINSLNVHQVEKNNIPFIGIELGCTWEAEHGVGVLLHGDSVVELGGALGAHAGPGALAFGMQEVD